MSNYTKTTNFATKDNLSPGNPLKIVKGTEIDTVQQYCDCCCNQDR